MIDKRTVFEIHRLHNSGYSNRAIANHLRVDRETVQKYITNPEPRPKPRKKQPSKLDPYRDEVKIMLQKYPNIKSPVVLQRLKDKGFTGGVGIIRSLLRQLRGESCAREPFIRFESQPGEQMQVDWGHFHSLNYENCSRKLYCLAVIESHSRMLYVHFTHSQKQEALHQGLLDAFHYWGGCPKEIVVDNMMTAVTERVGSLIRFNEQFLDFLRVFKITPRACNVRAPYEKGKVENSIKYIRNNFWPLRNFKDLADVQNQVLGWLSTVANVRIHQTTGQKPVDIFKHDLLMPLPDDFDCRETMSLKVHKDFGIRFDSNIYTVPPWAINKNVIVKADHRRVWVYYKEKTIAVHFRSWSKKKRIELPSHKEQVKKLRAKLYLDEQIRVFLSLGQIAADYLEKLTDANQPVKKTVTRLLSLQDEYGPASLLCALQKALSKKIYGADYIQNILYQEMTPIVNHQPVKLKKKELNSIRLTSPSLAEYDALALKRRKNQ